MEDVAKKDAARPAAGAEKAGNDPRERGTVDPDEEAAAASAKERLVAGWETRLPPELRDALANPSFGKVPASYQALIRNYLRWLVRQPGRSPDGAR